MSAISDELKVLMPLLSPFLQQGFDSVIVPKIQAEINLIQDPDIKALASAALPLVQTYVDSQIKKLAVV